MSEHQLIKCKEFYAARRSRLIRFMDNSPATRQLQREFTNAIAASSEQISIYKLILEAGEDFAGFNQRV
jgi:predicted ATP-grasp superfamily ATP-dependent carboligase